MAERYFMPEDVARLIPQLTACMERVQRAQKTARASQEWLDAEQQRITLSGGGVVDQAAWRERHQQVEQSTRTMQRGIEEIQGLGGVIKDLGLGLVDFLHLRGGREVNLCWRYGEQRINHWHGVNEGYAARKPLP
jgi:hypothetical protein